LLLALLYAGLMLYGSVGYIHEIYAAHVAAEDIPVPAWLLSLCLPLGFALLLFRLLQMGWRIAAGQLQADALAGETREAVNEATADGGPDATTDRR
jgi:C4-dicarboxylate transporter DctQ subunit